MFIAGASNFAAGSFHFVLVSAARASLSLPSRISVMGVSSTSAGSAGGAAGAAAAFVDGVAFFSSHPPKTATAQAAASSREEAMELVNAVSRFGTALSDRQKRPELIAFVGDALQKVAAETKKQLAANGG